MTEKPAQWPSQEWPVLWIKLTAMASLAIMVIFGLWPGLDLAVTGYFYSPADSFWVRQSAVIETLRMGLWRLSAIMVLFALAAVVFGASEGWLGIPKRAWIYVVALYVLGPGLLVDRVLKQYWGRARPSQVLDFGGTAEFTPVYKITDQCLSNCSFVSGEGAGAMAFVIALLVLLPFWKAALSAFVYRAAQGLALLVLVGAGWQRVGSGGHFLSDILMSYCLVLLVALGLQKLFFIWGVSGRV
jgi:lipid A 4'-phosphatase